MFKISKLLLATGFALIGLTATDPSADTSEPECADVNGYICVAYDTDGVVSFSAIDSLDLMYLELDCSDGDATACREAAYIFSFSKNPLQNREHAAKLYGQACDLGDAQACDEAGQATWPDNNAGPQALAALDYWRKGCDLNNIDACHGIATAYAHGIGGTPQEAIPKLETQCAALHYSACRSLGAMQSEGVGTNQDHKAAFANFTKACDGGDLQGCTVLGVMHYDGLGTDVDFQTAAQLFRQACTGGEAKACGLLGAHMYRGDIPNEDGEHAKALMQRSCDLGLERMCPLAEQFPLAEQN